jgi:hypothetical protein
MSPFEVKHLADFNAVILVGVLRNFLKGQNFVELFKGKGVKVQETLKSTYNPQQPQSYVFFILSKKYLHRSVQIFRFNVLLILQLEHMWQDFWVKFKSRQLIRPKHCSKLNTCNLKIHNPTTIIQMPGLPVFRILPIWKPFYSL